MTNDGKPRPLAAIIGESLRLFREEKGLRQEDVADAARHFGAEWGRSSVAALEGGNRDLRVEELILLRSIMQRLGGWSRPLVPMEVNLRLTATTHAVAGEALSSLYKLLLPTVLSDSEGGEDEVMQLGSIESPPVIDEFEKLQGIARSVILYDRILYTLWPEAGRVARPGPGGGELEFRMAERVRWPDTGESISVHLLQVLACAAWGRPATEERDSRTSERGTYETKRALQSARGHVTRDLIDELQELLNHCYSDIRSIIGDLDSVIDDEQALKQWRDESYEIERRARSGKPQKVSRRWRRKV